MVEQYRQHNLNNQQGIVLVMALIISALMMTSVLILTAALRQELRVSLNARNSIVAGYTAESGIEQGLYRLKYSQGVLNTRDPDFSKFTALEGQTHDIDGERSFEFTSSTVTALGFIDYNIPTSSPSHLNIIDPEGSLVGVGWGPATQYGIDWKINNCFPAHASDKLEITRVGFGELFGSTVTDVDIAICNCSADPDFENECDAYTSTDFDVNTYYRFSFRPLDSSVAVLDFDLYNGTEKIGILSEAGVKVIGKYHSVRFNMTAQLPALGSVSDVFSYVIFSEEELIKDL